MSASNWLLVGLCSFLGLCVGMCSLGVWQISIGMEGETEIRGVLCERVCSDRLSSIATIQRQDIGFSAYEWRCFCVDGHFQAMP